MSATSRRDFLRASVVTSAVFGAETALTAKDSRRSAEAGRAPRNVIFMVSDGMNHGALALARQYRGLAEQRETHWTRLYRERPVVRSLVETFSANSCVTDSAAAASAWGGGRRGNGGGQAENGPETGGQGHAELGGTGDYATETRLFVLILMTAARAAAPRRDSALPGASG